MDSLEDRITALRAALLRIHMQAIIENVAAPDGFVTFVNETSMKAILADDAVQASLEGHA